MLALLGACGGGPLAPDYAVPGPSAGGAPAEALDADLVGSWRRSTFATDGLGRVYGVTTIWSFGADGAAQRRLITDDVVAGVANEMVSVGGWSTVAVGGAGTVTLRFSAPAQTVLRLPYRLVEDEAGTALVLDGLTYRRHRP